MASTPIRFAGGCSLLVCLLAGALILALSGEAQAQERIRAQLSSVRQTTLSSEISAKISGLPFREGSPFKEGDTLITFDCSILEAQRNKAKAAAEAAIETFKVNTRLAELGSVSTLEIAQSEAKARETAAELETANVLVSKCSLTAPFTGRIAKLYVENHQYMTPGKPIMDIVDTIRLEIRLIVPSRWLTWLAVGSTFNIHIDETGRSYEARVVTLNPRIDPVSQTIGLIAEIAGNHPQLLPGMSGWVSFKKRP